MSQPESSWFSLIFSFLYSSITARICLCPVAATGKWPNRIHVHNYWMSQSFFVTDWLEFYDTTANTYPPGGVFRPWQSYPKTFLLLFLDGANFVELLYKTYYVILL